MAVLVESSAPVRSNAQRMVALQRANKIRSHRKRLKEDLKGYRRSPLAVLAEPEAEVESMKVFDLLLAAPKIGRVKANKMLLETRISPSKTVGGLSPRQRRELAAVLGGLGSRRPLL